MIFYYSGTGNSQLAAKQLAAETGDELTAVNPLLKKGEKSAFYTERPLVFVCPTYAWRMPRVFVQWIRETDFSGNGQAYFILTCGGGVGNAGAYAQKLCAEKHWTYYGLAEVVMPENYIALYDSPDESESEAIIARARVRITALAQLIREEKRITPPPVTVKGRLLSGPVNGLFYPVVVKDKAFWAKENCIGCGLCVKRCPLNNIQLSAGRPVWQGGCTHCMACIGGCPVEAIEYGTKSKGRRRHDVMEK